MWIAEAKKWVPNHLVVDELNENLNSDVVVIPVHFLQRHSERRERVLNFKFKYLIVDECHSWVRGQPGSMSNQLFCLRSLLVPRAQAVFFLTGTPFKGNVCWDFIETIRSLGSANCRDKWITNLSLDPDDPSKQEPSYAYTDEALRSLRNTWNHVPPIAKAQMLIPIMIRRTPNSRIDGTTVVEDYFARLVRVGEGDINIESLGDEMRRRDTILHGLGLGGTKRFNVARCLAWSKCYVTRNWELYGQSDPDWWRTFTLRDACEYKRGKTLVAILRKWRSDGYRPIIFAHSVFHQQFASRVLMSSESV